MAPPPTRTIMAEVIKNARTQTRRIILEETTFELEELPSTPVLPAIPASHDVRPADISIDIEAGASKEKEAMPERPNNTTRAAARRITEQSNHNTRPWYQLTWITSHSSTALYPLAMAPPSKRSTMTKVIQKDLNQAVNFDNALELEELNNGVQANLDSATPTRATTYSIATDTKLKIVTGFVLAIIVIWVIYSLDKAVLMPAWSDYRN